jgi:hypothetical protein
MIDLLQNYVNADKQVRLIVPEIYRVSYLIGFTIFTQYNMRIIYYHNLLSEEWGWDCHIIVHRHKQALFRYFSIK